MALVEVSLKIIKIWIQTKSLTDKYINIGVLRVALRTENVEISCFLGSLNKLI